jgi:hypothetical protein
MQSIRISDHRCEGAAKQLALKAPYLAAALGQTLLKELQLEELRESLLRHLRHLACKGAKSGFDVRHLPLRGIPVDPKPRLVKELNGNRGKEASHCWEARENFLPALKPLILCVANARELPIEIRHNAQRRHENSQRTRYGRSFDGVGPGKNLCNSISDVKL